MKLKNFLIVVKDIGRAKQFYHDLFGLEKITDNDGNYAWDVPEGWWQVKYELDGYENVYSEWLPVPPPQTDVHIGMISLKTPNVVSAEITDDGLKIVFDSSGGVFGDLSRKSPPLCESD